MSPAPDWSRASSAVFAGAIEIWGRHRRGPSRRRRACEAPPSRGTCRAARRRPSRAPPSGAPTIQWAGVARERSLVLPVLLTAIVGLGALSIDMFLPSLPAMTLAFGSDAATAQLTVTLFLAGLAAAQLVWGPLSDRLGRRRVLLAGLAVYATAGTACAFAPSMSLLVANAQDRKSTRLKSSHVASSYSVFCMEKKKAEQLHSLLYICFFLLLRRSPRSTLFPYTTLFRSFLAGLAAAQLVWGPLSDRLGRRRVLLAGLAVYATAGTACAFAPSMSLLVANA